jgi:hypothetical protein
MPEEKIPPSDELSGFAAAGQAASETGLWSKDGGAETEIVEPVTDAAPDLAWSDYRSEPQPPLHRSWRDASGYAVVFVVIGIVLASMLGIGSWMIHRYGQIKAPPTPPVSGPAPSTTQPDLQGAPTPTGPAPTPAPHSALADIDLPFGTVPIPVTASSTSADEEWDYSVPYPDTVKFLQNQFAAGRRDTRGGTWWHGLAPCYNPKGNPPGGWDNTKDGLVHGWGWSDSAVMLWITVISPDERREPDLRLRPSDGVIIISRFRGNCYGPAYSEPGPRPGEPGYVDPRDEPPPDR